MSIPDSVEINEGETSLIVPAVHSSGGPGKRIGKVFFNSQMAFNRDVSVMLLRARPVQSALDAMSGTGARAVRWGREIGGGMKVTANDRTPEAVEYISANIALNRLEESCQASHDDLRSLLARRAYDYIDIDPFGSPVPFIPAAMQAVKRHGVLGITATDTAPLAGAHPRKCLRRYDAMSVRSPFGHETGLRILIGHLIKEAAKEDRGARCLLSFYADHYFRTYLQMEEGGAAADAALGKLGYIEYDKTTGKTTVSMEPISHRSAGPLWLGPLHDSEILKDMNADETLAAAARCKKYLKLWREEVDIPFFYENDELSSLLHMSPPRMDRLLEQIGASGNVSRTHFSPTAFKTDLEFNDVLAIYRDIAGEVSGHH